MTPEFAAAVDPVFLSVFDLLDRISRNENTVVIKEHDQLVYRLRAADAQLSHNPGWHYAKFALAAWIDEALVDAPWGGSDWWAHNSLEFQIFGSRNGATLFYENAQECQRSSEYRDALEVYYATVMVGFRGLYKHGEAPFLAEKLGLPQGLEGWAKNISHSIRFGEHRSHISERPRIRRGAPPLMGRRVLAATLLGTVILLAILIVVSFSAFGLDSWIVGK